MGMVQITGIKKFASRCRWIFIWLTIVQFFHISFVAVFDYENLLVLGLIFAIGMLCMSLIIMHIKNTDQWPVFNLNIFNLLFLTSAFFVLIFSRLEYVQGFFIHGLYANRANEEIGRGGWYSIFTIMFYPLCIILTFVKMPLAKYYFYIGIMFLVMFIDLIYLGTRGAPIFVIFFHFCMSKWRFKSLWFAAGLLLGLIVFVMLFDWQTQARSLDSISVGWDWVNALRYSWIADNLEIREDILLLIGDGYSFMFPVIYLMQYLSHSVAELRLLFDADVFSFLGNFVYLHDQICLVFLCDREITQLSISAANPRAGLYQTLYSSLIIDFGWFGLSILIAALVLLYAILKFLHVGINAITIYLLVILAVSGVENYIYNGLGWARFLIFIALFHGLSRKTNNI